MCLQSAAFCGAFSLVSVVALSSILAGRGPINVAALTAGAPEERVERGGAVRALLERGIDVKRHLRVGAADLAHQPT
jgi:hypothetical protein